MFFLILIFFVVCVCHDLQVARHKSKKGGIQKRVYFWAGICWYGKTPGVAWTASDNKVIFRHTKNLCHGTLFEDDGIVWRVVQTRAASDNNHVYYVDHFQSPDVDPPFAEWEHSSYAEVKDWHDESRARLAARDDLKPPTSMQDTAKTLSIYEDALYPTLRRFGLDEVVEDNASPHNNDVIRDSHRRHHCRIVGYTATEEEKDQIKALIELQTANYRREQDKKAQMTKQTKELDRLPAWYVFVCVTHAQQHSHTHTTHSGRQIPPI